MLNIKNKYHLDKKIGKGSFGEVWKATNVLTEEHVAVKLEDLSERNILKREASIIKYLEGVKGIPKIRNFGIANKKYYMVMDLLDKSPVSLNKPGFSLKSVIEVAHESVNILSKIHKRGIIHRDIKPDNFLFDTTGTKLYLIDFGLARQYKDDRGDHRPIQYKKSLTGTVRYLSKHCHSGIEPSRRDDLISLCYMLIYLMKGTLPWQGLSGKTKKEKVLKIFDKKDTVTHIKLCEGLPIEMLHILDYCYELGYDENPNYEYIKIKLIDFGREKRIKLDGNYGINKD